MASPGTYKGVQITAGTDADIQRQIAQIDTLSPVTADALKPIKPLTAPVQSVPTGTVNLLGSIGASADTYLKDLSAKRADAEQNRDASLRTLVTGMFEDEGEVEATNRLYADNVDPLEKELSQINNDILAEQRALETTVRRIKENKEGLFGGAVEQEIRRVESESLERQADLAILQMAKQGQFDSAKRIADRAVAALMERQRMESEVRRFLYDEYKEDFTKAEQREFEANEKERERIAERQEYEYRARFDQKLAQADPLYQLQIARARKELSLLGEPTAKEREEIAAKLQEAQSSVPAMQDKINAIDVLKGHPGMSSRVGTTIFDRGPRGPLGVAARALTGPFGLPSLFGATVDTATGSGQDFAGGIHKLTSGLNLQELIEAKSRGATFGALSNQELRVLASAASSISDWEVKKNVNGEQVPTGFWDIDEGSFKRELDTIRTLTLRALERSGSSLMSPEEEDLINTIFDTTNFNPATYY